MHRSFLNRTLSKFPKNQVFGTLISLLRFMKSHKRLPKKSSFNDVLFQYKINDELLSPARQFTSDKELVKIFVRGVVGEKFNVPTVVVLKTTAEVDQFEFELGQIVKPTHASGYVKFIEKQVTSDDRNEIKSWFYINYFRSSRENNYKYLQPKVIVEPLLFNEKNLKDYKFFCVNGKVKVIQVDFDRHLNHTRKLYDSNWNDLNASIGYPLSSRTEPQPRYFEDMKNVCEKLAAYFSFVRIDLYYHPTSVEFYVGEITHCHGGASEVFNSQDKECLVSKILFE